MKQLFAVFCAFVLLPMFTTQAWIGGPFSNNNYFGETGDDGIYEASASAVNGIGLFRFAVGNDFAGSQDFLTANVTVPIFDDDGNVVANLTSVGVNSGNTIFGGFGQDSNLWFIEGVSYSGSTNGTVNSVSGSVAAVANATDNTSTFIVASGFKGTLTREGPLLPVSSFRGTGQGAISQPFSAAPAQSFRFTVFGSRVSSEILFGI